MALTLLRTDPDTLLATSARKRQSGDFDSAISILKKAYIEIVERNVVFEAEIFTRLPLLLQQANRSREGWQEIHKLMTRGCPGRSKEHSKVNALLDRATICDKARLFLQREGQNDRAVLYGLQFYICRWLACHYQPNLGKLGPMRSEKAVRGIVKPLLKKANKEPLEDELVAELKATLHREPTLDHRAFLARVAAMLAVFDRARSSAATTR